ncbi:hypothetical protein ASE04_27525 [Rhizobium sp. Root708]|uniref:hypothetical protein n=1 Tax=Rhizobium sp. Root708 TaxID=1736592 RepID=UPI0006F8F3E8|nr:hypothetical protein [Rhizobium sp. Root708]KRB58467.1 hypothetical protein ASE04_27525 [Rhizobium sp. Root708]
MFRENTTFVIGAGASAEFGMPVGTELAQRIKRSAVLRNLGAPKSEIGDQNFFETLLRAYPAGEPRERAIAAARAIQGGIHTAVSIDAFIDRFPEEREIANLGKVLIALEIIKAEDDCSLTAKREPDFEARPAAPMLNKSGKQLINPDNTWIGHFFRILCDGVRNAKDIGRGVSIVCFNYDRCIEYYLRKQIAAAYRITLSEAHEIVMGMNIIHPYGTLGELALHDSGYGEKKLGFGLHPSDVELEHIAANIKTYTEQQHDPETIGRIHGAIEFASVLVFLGFGFNNQNLDLLRVDGGPAKREHRINPVVYSSGYGIAKQVEDTLKRRILHLLYSHRPHHDAVKNRVSVEFGQTCAELFSVHNMNLSSFTRAVFTPGALPGISERTVISFGDE